MKKSPIFILITIIMVVGIIGIGAWQLKGGNRQDNKTISRQDESKDFEQNTDTEQNSDTSKEEDASTTTSDPSSKNEGEMASEMPEYEYSQNIDENGTLTIPEETMKIENAAYEEDSRITSVVIPETVTSIGDSAFSGTSLSEVVIPESVSEIGERAFSKTELKKADIPASVEKVASTAFADNTELQEITVSPENNTYTSVDGILYTDGGKTLVTVPAGVESVTVPAEVTKIEEGAISGKTDTIYGYIDSAAEDYAVVNDLIFISVQ